MAQETKEGTCGRGKGRCELKLERCRGQFPEGFTEDVKDSEALSKEPWAAIAYFKQRRSEQIRQEF